MLHRGGLTALLFLVLSLMGTGQACAAGPLLSAGLGFEFASGRYGTGTRTDSVYAPFTAAYYPTERLGLSLEIPYLYQSSSSVNAAVVQGAGMQMSHMKKMPSMTDSGMGAGTTGPSSAAGTGAGPAAGGLGDIIAKGSYVLVPEGNLMPRVRPYFLLKIPTADRDRGLGTGAFDEGFMVELTKQLGNWYSFAEGGYTLQGNNAKLRLSNYISYSAGTGYAFRDRFLPMLLVKGSTPPFAGSSSLLEIRLKLKYLATPQTGLAGYVAKGITTNSPDYGSGLAIFHDF